MLQWHKVLGGSGGLHGHGDGRGPRGLHEHGDHRGLNPAPSATSGEIETQIHDFNKDMAIDKRACIRIILPLLK